MDVVLYSLLGLVLGSFLNLCIDRLPRGESILTTHSHCDACGHTLGPLDLVPVFSYLALRGRCRYCGARVSLRSPLVELGTAALFALIWLRFSTSLQGVLVAVYGCLLIPILVIDLEHHRVLNKLSYPAIGLALAAAAIAPGRSPWEMLAGGGLGSDAPRRGEPLVRLPGGLPLPSGPRGARAAGSGRRARRTGRRDKSCCRSCRAPAPRRCR